MPQVRQVTLGQTVLSMARARKVVALPEPNHCGFWYSRRRVPDRPGWRYLAANPQPMAIEFAKDRRTDRQRMAVEDDDRYGRRASLHSFRRRQYRRVDDGIAAIGLRPVRPAPPTAFHQRRSKRSRRQCASPREICIPTRTTESTSTRLPCKGTISALLLFARSARRKGSHRTSAETASQPKRIGPPPVTNLTRGGDIVSVLSADAKRSGMRRAGREVHPLQRVDLRELRRWVFEIVAEVLAPLLPSGLIAGVILSAIPWTPEQPVQQLSELSLKANLALQGGTH